MKRKNEKKRGGVANKEKIKAKRKRKEKASRRSRGARERREKEKKEKGNAGRRSPLRSLLNACRRHAATRTPAALQAAPARETTFRVWPADWGGGSRTEEGKDVGREAGRMLR